MNIQAIWENGVYMPQQPIGIKHTKLTFVLPDEESETVAAENLPVFDQNDFWIEVREKLAKKQAINDAAQKILLSVDADRTESEEQEQCSIYAMKVGQPSRSGEHHAS